MREWRKNRELSDEEKFKDIARSYLNVYIKRGKVVRQPCEVCGATENVEGHHHDYSKPLDVRWLCRRHHKDEHLVKRQRVAAVPNPTAP